MTVWADLLLVGENHWRAKLTDHEVDLIRGQLAERTALIEDCRRRGMAQGAVDRALRTAGLSYGRIALRFEISKATVRDLQVGRRRQYTGALIDRQC